MTNICINCIHKDVCYKYRLNYVCVREGTCTDYYEMPKKGKWIEGKNGTIKCNQCSCEIFYSYLIDNKPQFPKFCCDCGAKMKEADNE